MLYLRETLVSRIPETLQTIIAELPTPSSIMNASFSTSTSGEEQSTSDKSQAIPGTLIKEQWQLVLGEEASIVDLKNAIDKCKEMVLSNEELSEERKWLVRHLVELRYRHKELQELPDDQQKDSIDRNTKVILGHHFNTQKTLGKLPTAKQYCDHCSGIIWSVVQASLVCNDCSFVSHIKCAEKVIRVCAHVISSERKYPIIDICPEMGIAAQQYKCGECKAAFSFKKSWIEPRLCDYSGLYYCQMCHWNDNSIIPARIIHNWDFSQRKVCRASIQEINLILDKPVIKLEEKNEKLFIFLHKLNQIKKIRENLSIMRKYLSECRFGKQEKLLETQIGSKRHLVQSADFYSINDMIRAQSGELTDFLNRLFDIFNKHIRSCDVCSGKGYICEVCRNREVMYPFEEGCIPCEKCNSIYHRACWLRKNMQCLKCNRIQMRTVKDNQDETIEEN